MLLRGVALTASLGVLVFGGGADAANSPKSYDSERTGRPSAEAYLQASLRELATFRSYGDAGSREAAQLVTALKEAASELPPPEQVGAKRSW